mgnify:CR=1 FL=1
MELYKSIEDKLYWKYKYIPRTIDELRIDKNIVNNIQMNFEKYLFRILKAKINILFKEQNDYNSLVKKCSYYEFSIDADNKDKPSGKVKFFGEQYVSLLVKWSIYYKFITN